MNRKSFEKLAALPKLSQANRQAVSCKICGDHAYFFDLVDFNKVGVPYDFYCFGMSGIAVPYFRCTVCRFLFTPFFDDWTAQEFSQFIYNEDYIKVDGEYTGIRAKREAASIAKRLGEHKHLRVLDYGSGSGVFADHLRSLGFANVTCYDPFSSPIRPGGPFDVITCFEVIEHSTTPHSTLADIAALLNPAGCVVFTTAIQSSAINELRANWWYVAPRNGHVSIFSRNSLARLAQDHGLLLYANTSGTAFGGASLSLESKQILTSFGSPSRFISLMAPGHDESSADAQRKFWHGIERSGILSYRWTGKPEILWRTQPEPIPSCGLTVVIPVANEIQTGFSRNCRLEVGPSSSQLVADSGVLTASFSIEQPVEALFKLVTPNPMRPCDIRPVNDMRTLGLAIAVGAEQKPVIADG